MRAWRTVRFAPAMVAAFALTACGGRDPRPIAWNQPTDKEARCSKLVQELTYNETAIIERLPALDQTGRNAFLYSAGAILILPWFALDLRFADSIEIRAYFERNAWLRELGARKGCEMPPARVKMGQQPATASPDVSDN